LNLEELVNANANTIFPPAQGSDERGPGNGNGDEELAYGV
jgi:hypothetical protein